LYNKIARKAAAAAVFGSLSYDHHSGRDMLLNQRLRLGGGLLALGVVALFAAHPSPVRGGSSHNLESHQYKDSRKCLLQLTARTLGCGGSVKRTVGTTKRRPDKRQHGGGGGDSDNDLDQNNNNFDYNYDDDDGGGGGDSVEPRQTFYEPPLITDPRDRMLPVIYSPRPMYAPPRHQQQQSQQQQPPYNRYDEQGVGPINPFEVPIIIGECVLQLGHVYLRFVWCVRFRRIFFLFATYFIRRVLAPSVRGCRVHGKFVGSSVYPRMYFSSFFEREGGGEFSTILFMKKNINRIVYRMVLS